ncbi:MAG: outer membrane protein assembly factor BamE [Spongiibacteraceae bacterium]|nr:outer membrane protein assembly factor BamE [Spongiibacteraceae bacterium]
MPKYLPIILSLLLAACANVQFPGVYKVAIEQGNIIEQEMVDQLKPGMSRNQVEYVLGTALIKDTFNAERWDYLYSIQKGDEPRKQHRLTVFFEGDSLKYFTGDFVPASAATIDSPETPKE